MADDLLPPIPHACEILLKSEDRAEACPDEDRCQLEITLNDDPGLEVEDGAVAASKLVRVFLKQQDSGCDAMVRVGLVQDGGPVAVGLSGEVWERKLTACQAEVSPLITDPPLHLLSTRYRHGAEIICLTVWQGDSSWHVLVDGPGKRVFHRLFVPAQDDLRVSAALSPDFKSLYITESRLVGGDRFTIGYWYSYTATGGWSLFFQRAIPKPYGGDDPSTRAVFVGRDGVCYGYWAANRQTVVEQDNTGQICLGAEGYLSTKEWSELNLAADGWSLREDGPVSNGSRYLGPSLAAGDLHLLREVPGDVVRQQTVDYRYEWTNPGDGTHTRQEQSMIATGLEFQVKDGGNLVTGSKDFGLSYQAGGSSEGWERHIPDPLSPTGYGYEFSTTYWFTGYSYHNGRRLVSLTPGGWLLSSEMATVKTADLSGGAVSGVHHADNYVPPCPDFTAVLDDRAVSTTVDEDGRVLYPKGLGLVAAVDRSFTALDTQSGQLWCGAMTRETEEGEPGWHLFRGNLEISQEVAACTGKPLADLRAIYFRS